MGERAGAGKPTKTKNLCACVSECHIGHISAARWEKPRRVEAAAAARVQQQEEG